MCGITGIYHFNNSKNTNKSELLSSSETLIHRGPDDAGTYISPSGRLGLGFRRLAIIDLSERGHQPMSDDEGYLWIVFNGEIYNYKEIRSQLIERGYSFRSGSDTEVVINAYKEYGSRCVNLFNGMFAFALWNEREQKLFIARDHAGIKPFYYAIQNGTFYFGSEIKAILAYPEFKKCLNEENISYYLTFSSLPAPHTLFCDIKKLPTAHAGELDSKGNFVITEYWNPLQAKTPAYTEEEYISETRRLLQDSIQKQMISDVPFGCFLSGGIDSSTNAALMGAALKKPVVTFSVGYRKETHLNELSEASATAKLLGAEHSEVIIDEEDLLSFIPRYAYHADDPNGDQACFPLYYLAKLAHEKKTTVVQIGEGSDELFSGYDTYLKAYRLHSKYWQTLSRFPQFLKTLLYKAGSSLPHSKSDFIAEHLRRLYANECPYWGNAIAFSDHQKRRLLNTEYASRTSHTSRSHSIIESYTRAAESTDSPHDFLRTMTYLELKQRLSELLLMRADKMIMAHSIEGRVPFLDTRLIELALSMPAKLKFKNKEPKYVLKRAVEGIIPHEIIYRKKRGFSTPIAEWLRSDSEVSRVLEGTILKSRLRESNIINYEYVREIIGQHKRKQADHSFRIWNLVTLSLWYDYWF